MTFRFDPGKILYGEFKSHLRPKLKYIFFMYCSTFFLFVSIGDFFFVYQPLWEFYKSSFLFDSFFAYTVILVLRFYDLRS